MASQYIWTNGGYRKVGETTVIRNEITGSNNIQSPTFTLNVSVSSNDSFNRKEILCSTTKLDNRLIDLINEGKVVIRFYKKRTSQKTGSRQNEVPNRKKKTGLKRFCPLDGLGTKNHAYICWEAEKITYQTGNNPNMSNMKSDFPLTSEDIIDGKLNYNLEEFKTLYNSSYRIVHYNDTIGYPIPKFFEHIEAGYIYLDSDDNICINVPEIPEEITTEYLFTIDPFINCNMNHANRCPLIYASLVINPDTAEEQELDILKAFKVIVHQPDGDGDGREIPPSFIKNFEYEKHGFFVTYFKSF